MVDAHDPHSHDSACTDSGFTVSRLLTCLAVGGAVVGTGVILAPYVLPSLGVGTESLFEDAFSRMHLRFASASLAITEAGSPGLAGILNRGIANYVPVIGEKLARGGMFSAAISGSIGLGGSLLGKFIEKREDGSHRVKLGAMVKYASMAASALIALPTLISGLSVGLIYLADLTKNNTFIDCLVGVLDQTLGVSGGKMHAAMGLGSVAGALPHIAACCASLLPAMFTVTPLKPKEKEVEAVAYQPVDKKLLPDDPNRSVTPQQKSMVEEYNKAPPTKKPILKKWFKDHGFNPHYHSDGTMDLFQHTTGMSR